MLGSEMTETAGIEHRQSNIPKQLISVHPVSVIVSSKHESRGGQLLW
jgi:hypothetical protein